VNRSKNAFVAVVLGGFILASALDVSVAESALLQGGVPSLRASPTPSRRPTVGPTSTVPIPQRLEALETRVSDLNEASCLSTWELAMDIIVGLTTAIGIVVSGIWAYRLFVRKRQKYPRATVSHAITHKPLSGDKVLLHVELTISNIGDILISLGSLATWIQQVLPPPAEVLDLLRDERAMVKDGESEYGWPEIGSCDLDFHAQKPEKGPGDGKREVEPEIEPGEREEICFDFVLASGVQVIKVNSYVKNEAKPDREIGWNLTSLYDLADRVAMRNESQS